MGEQQPFCQKLALWRNRRRRTKMGAGAHFERYVPAAGTMTIIRESVRCSPLFTRRFCLFRSVVAFAFEMYKLQERERTESFLRNGVIYPSLRCNVDYTPAFHRPLSGRPTFSPLSTLFSPPCLSSCSKIDAFEEDFHRRDRILFLSVTLITASSLGGILLFKGQD